MARRENPSGGNHFEQTMSECDFTELALACLCAGFIRVGIVEAGSLSWRMAVHCSWKWKAAVLYCRDKIEASEVKCVRLRGCQESRQPGVDRLAAALRRPRIPPWI
jgi:hypothetical protein